LLLGVLKFNEKAVRKDANMAHWL